MRRGDPSLGKTKVAFAVRTRGDRSRPPLGTILATDGGPGYGSTAAPFVRSLNAALAPLLRRRDVVYVDARGTGLSDPLDCRTLQRGLILESTAIGECANQLGPRFAGYTTGETADDLDAVREALGLGRVFFYGDSYGTLLGQAYAVRHPVGLRGLILDSAYPADDPYYRTLLPAGLRGLEIACRRAPDCSGDAAGRYSRVVRRFHARGRPTDALLSFLLQSGTLAPRSYLSLDEGDRRYLAGDPRRLNRLIAPGPPGHGAIREFTYGLEITVECNDYPLLWDPYQSIDSRIRRALDLGQANPGRPLRPVRRSRVPALTGRAPDQLPHLAGTAGGRARAAGAGRLEGAAELPDPDPRRGDRRHHLGHRGEAGQAEVPALATEHHAQPRPRLEPLLPVPLTRGGSDS